MVEATAVQAVVAMLILIVMVYCVHYILVCRAARADVHTAGKVSLLDVQRRTSRGDSVPGVHEILCRGRCAGL